MTHTRRVAAIVAHPDDEMLGCGGALARHAAHGDEVSIIILADGETSRGAPAQYGRYVHEAMAFLPNLSHLLAGQIRPL